MAFLPGTYGLDVANDTSDPLGNALTAAPDLTNSPALAVAAAQSPAPADTAQALSHAQYMNALQQAVGQEMQHPHGGGWFGSLTRSIGDLPGISTALSWAGKPLAEAQADYRYIHSQFAQRGFFEGLTSALTVAGGAGAGFLVGGPVGAVVGADIGGAAARHGEPLLMDDSVVQKAYQQSNDPNYKVSIGRDLAHLVGAGNTDQGVGKVISGVADAVFDFKADPLVLAGKASVLRKTGELGKIGDSRVGQLLAGKLGFANAATDSAPIAQRIQSVQNFFDRVAPGMKISSPEQVAQATKAYAPVRRAFGTLAQIVNDAPTAERAAGAIVDRFPEQQGLASRIAALKGKGAAGAVSADDVAKAYAAVPFDTDMLRRVTLGTLPSRSLGRALFGSSLTEQLKGIGSESTLSGDTLTGEAAGGKMGRAARTIRTFTGYKPYALDNGTLNLSTKTFDPTDPGALQGVLRVMRYSMGSSLARDYTGKMALAMEAGDVGIAKGVWAEAQLEMLKAAGLPDDYKLVQQISDQTRGIVHGPDGTQAYGSGLQRGRDVSEAPLRDANGDIVGHAPQALWGDQEGHFSYPDFNQVKQAIRSLHGAKNALGKVDDFVASHWTNTIFKPLALLTAGFGLRVAAAEAIPAAMRYGAMNLIRARVNATAQKMNYRLANGEDSHVIAAMSRAAGGMQKLIADPESRDLAARIVLANDGHILKGVAATGHNDYELPENATDKASASLWALSSRKIRSFVQDAPGGPAQFFHDTQDFGWFPSALATDEGKRPFAEQWMTELQKRSQQVPAQRIAQDALTYSHPADLTRLEAQRIKDALDGVKGALPTYRYEAQRLSRYTNQTPEEFAADRVDSLLGLVTGADGTVHRDVLEKLAAGQKPTIEELAAKDGASLPAEVIAPLQEGGYIGPNVMQRIVNEGFKRVVDPIINKLSREPLYLNAVKEEWRALKPAIDEGILDEHTALAMAQRRASISILPQIHNTKLKSQFAVLAQNFLPFYFAQEQAVKRYAHLLAKNPGAFREYEIINHGLNDPGFVKTDDQGNRYMVFPGSAGWGGAVLGGLGAMGGAGMVQTGLPVSVSGNMDSLSTVIPEAKLPQVGPMLSIPLNLAAAHIPELAPYVQGAVGDRSFGQALQDELIPNAFLRNIVRGMQGDDRDRQFHNAYLSALAAAYAHGQAPSADATPQEQQAFLDHVKAAARSGFYLKALISTFSPLSPSVNYEDYSKALPGTLRDEFYTLTKPKAEGGAGLDYQTALASFLKEHGKGALAYTVAKSDNTAGANVPNSAEALQFVQDNAGLIADGKYRNAAAFLVPQANTNDGNVQLIHNELLAMHLRENRTPEDFLNAIYQQQGTRNYYAAKQQRDDAIAAAGTNKRAVSAIGTIWSQQQDAMKLTNPVWADYFYSPDRQIRASQIVTGLIQLFRDGKAPAGPQTDLTSSLLNAYQQHLSTLAAIGPDRARATARAAERERWSNVLADVRTQQPALSNLVDTVFRPLQGQ